MPVLSVSLRTVERSVIVSLASLALGMLKTPRDTTSAMAPHLPARFMPARYLAGVFENQMQLRLGVPNVLH